MYSVNISVLWRLNTTSLKLSVAELQMHAKSVCGFFLQTWTKVRVGNILFIILSRVRRPYLLKYRLKRNKKNIFFQYFFYNGPLIIKYLLIFLFGYFFFILIQLFSHSILKQNQSLTLETFYYYKL